MAKCDLCGAQCFAHELEQLLTQYRVAGITDVCPTCRRWADRKKLSLIDEIAPKMREAILERSQRKPNFYQRALAALARTFSA